MNIETLSARDKFWLHHVVSLRYQTTAAQMRLVIDALRSLRADWRVEGNFVRVRFFRLGSFSLDIEVVAYIFTSDWDNFLEVQQQLLLRIMEIVEQAGTGIALPSQTLHLADTRNPSGFLQDRTAIGSGVGPDNLRPA